MSIKDVPFFLETPLTSFKTNQKERNFKSLQQEALFDDIQKLLRINFSTYSPISCKLKNNQLKVVSMVGQFNDTIKYLIEIIIDLNGKAIRLSYVISRENGQQYFIESKAQRLLIMRGINKLNQNTDVGVYCINNRGGIRFKQHIFFDEFTFDEMMEQYQTHQISLKTKKYKQIAEITVDTLIKENLNEDLSQKRIITLLQRNIEAHLPQLNINIAKILYLCDELEREYFDILERQGAQESQKLFDALDQIHETIEETVNTNKIYVEEISDTSAFQNPAQTVEQGLKTKILQEINIKKIKNKENIGSGGFGTIFKADIVFSGMDQNVQSITMSHQNQNYSQSLHTQSSSLQNPSNTDQNTRNQTILTSNNNNIYVSQATNQSQRQQLSSIQNSSNSQSSITDIQNSSNISNSQSIREEEGVKEHTKQYVLKKNIDFNSSDRNRVQHEIDILKLLEDYECPYIAKYFYSKQAEYSSYLIIEFYKNKDLDTFKRNFSNTSSLISKIELMYQFSSGLKFLNDRGFYHLDIKPANILVSNKHQIKITDFGECYHYEICENKYLCDWDERIKEANIAHLEKIPWKMKTPKEVNPDIKFKPAKTMPYCPPEALSSKLQINYQSDIFSLGVMMCELFFDEFPFKFKKSKYSFIEQKFKEQKWESFLPEEYVCKHKGPEKITKIILKLALLCLNASKLEKDKDDNKSYKLDRPCLSQIIIILKKCKEYLEQRYITAFNKP
ncbi:kinase domain protein (macronuclear) [Tetrahymena thermophila SB210]|uniref:Kinase domain protein n=1 Tax=Tetrahymena thermophila (strain SB210) TaxID=312017 RepID=Q24I25_TETTS|nr:kinase domain protein [Tetrahymena thermophila SB210]EAS07413.2 kinase domain protein [Tetrahymena thermophila SB210]|eukprot:XP_001027655.2 kinase domain protein [Tetrahymena thermophila SB210]